jgi:hypothetical protein
MVREGPTAESINLSDALCVPFAKGVNVTVTVQLAYAATLVPQVFV